MTSYCRNYQKGGTYFFTVAINHRKSNLLTKHIQKIKTAIIVEKNRHPFIIIALVILPDHLHCIWRLPDGDSDYSTRWRNIKSVFSKNILKQEIITTSRDQKKERGLWQRRFWEHTISNEEDLRRHIDYIHYNPVKHKYVKCSLDWPYSTFHNYVKKGMYSPNWGLCD